MKKYPYVRLESQKSISPLYPPTIVKYLAEGHFQDIEKVCNSLKAITIGRNSVYYPRENVAHVHGDYFINSEKGNFLLRTSVFSGRGKVTSLTRLFHQQSKRSKDIEAMLKKAHAFNPEEEEVIRGIHLE